MAIETVSVIGPGYIGFPTAAIFGSRGVQVTGCDVNKDVVDTINEGQVHTAEPDLDILVRATVRSGRLRATTSPERTDVFIIAVHAPFEETHKTDLPFIEAVAQSIALIPKKEVLVVLESTSPVGTTNIPDDFSSLNTPLTSTSGSRTARV